MATSAELGYPRLVIAVSVVMGVASLLFLWALLHDSGPGSVANASRIAANIRAASARLNVKPRTVELVSEKAMRARVAIAQGDFATAHRIAAAVLAGSRQQIWRFYPFTDFAAGLVDLTDPGFGAKLDAWAAAEPEDAIRLLVGARYDYEMAWRARGHEFAKDTSAERLAAFRSGTEKAAAEVEKAIKLGGDNPYGFQLRLLILRGSGFTENFGHAFEAAIGRFPDYYPLYDVALSTLEPRWGGSVAAMYALVDRYAGHAGENSPLRLLYLALYRDLLASASVACTDYRHDSERLKGCVASEMGKLATPALEQQVEAALQLYRRTEPYQFDGALKDILFEMLRTPGGDTYSGAILEHAANATGSDTQLKEDDPGHNDYLIDEAVGYSWYLKAFPDNAMAKYREALADAEKAQFPGEAAKDLALSDIYDRMAAVSDAVHQFVDLIAYERAAIALGGVTGNEHFICYGYFSLRQYGEALGACTEAIARTGSVPAHYWRGVVRQTLGRMDEAVADYTVVADSDDGLRSLAAIAISYIYASRKDLQRSLSALDKYAYLFDAQTQRPEDLAVSYNNRCYDYMELGELKRALDDCTASLKYGSLPDAYRKQQELIKRLKAHETGL